MHPRAIYELWADASTYEEIHVQNKANEPAWSPFKYTTFKFNASAMYHTIPEDRQKRIIEEFSYMAYEGVIDLKRPDVALQYFEECGSFVVVTERMRFTHLDALKQTR